jgi:hypothetical protein
MLANMRFVQNPLGKGRSPRSIGLNMLHSGGGARIGSKGVRIYGGISLTCEWNKAGLICISNKAGCSVF